MNYSGTKKFEIVNQSTTNIANFRLTHFLSEECVESTNKVVTKPIFEKNESIMTNFEAVNGKEDLWFVQFDTPDGDNKMTKALKCNMREKGSDYRIIITNSELIIEWNDNFSTLHAKGTYVKPIREVME
ncbi:hypothetical protein [Aureivirga sp. CE67]|uniref:hypothetical protein n=1 Tax=Aureivirga sp. CE67 TaxID=1788983 RepID=UPI0018CAF9CE|nr:hypothetical protein [Aureivirga sp. CE67]